MKKLVHVIEIVAHIVSELQVNDLGVTTASDISLFICYVDPLIIQITILNADTETANMWFGSFFFAWNQLL